jgi:hypothetical protein
MFQFDEGGMTSPDQEPITSPGPSAAKQGASKT